MKYQIRIVIFLVLLGIFGVSDVHADTESSQILSVTPPLFQIIALPGDVWQSSLKVVNGNAFPLTIYAEVAHFSPLGEFGQGNFSPIEKNSTSTEGTDLAEWIDMAKGPYTIQPEQTQDISFIVDIPKNASPGGHYAAILISTEPPQDDVKGPEVKTSQSVTSLFFLRIEGDVIEDGDIREFRVNDTLQEKPNADFFLRFENKGNVHLLPRGEIRITNMWGTERGVIPVNYQTQFGNVLPKSIREYHYTWNSDFTFSDIGRYKAVATLGYGTDGVKSVSSVVYFWVIPLKATLIVILTIASIIMSIVWMVRAYVRRMLLLAGVDTHTQSTSRYNDTVLQSTSSNRPPYLARKHITAPIRRGVLDLRTRMNGVNETFDIITTIWSFVRMYKKFFISLLLIIIIFVITVQYIGNATEKHTRFNVTLEEGGESTVLNGEDVLHK